MKKIVSLILALACLFAFTACDGGKKELQNPSTADVLAELTSNLTFAETGKIDYEYNYEFDSSKMVEYSYIMAGSGIEADEVFVAKTASEADAEELLAQMNRRKDSLYADFEAYSPEECPKIKSAVIKTYGPYAVFAITSDNAKAEKLLDGVFYK